MKKLSTPFLILILFMAIAPIYVTAQSWPQKGMDIDGEAVNDFFSNVSMPDANTVAIGANSNDGNGSDAGHVRIYSWNGMAWIQKGIDIDGEAADDRSGWSVSMPDANTMAIGALNNDGNGSNSGHVRIYSWNGNAWMQKGLDIDGEAANDNSGYSVSMPDANTVTIGAIYNDGNGNDAGHVRIYSWSGTAWVQKGMDINGEASGDNSSYSVSMPDANTVAIGANSNDGNGSDAGQVRIYSWDGTVWVQKGIDIDGEAAGDNFGFSVNMPDANTVAIGAVGNDGNGSNSGHVRIYSWNGAAWIQKGLDLDGEAAGDELGWSVSMPDANTLAIGAAGNDGNGIDAGHVRIYSWNGTAWVQKGLDINGEAAFDHSNKVSMPDAKTLAIGAPGNDGNGSNSGHVRIYSCNTFISISPSVCNSYTSPSGNNTWTISGTYMDTIPNATGCDSIITINLTVNTLQASITNNSPILTANPSGATYQWVDCNNSFAIINGNTNQSYTANTSGNYAVIVTENNCIDTSDCMIVTTVGLTKNNFNSTISLYPNPSNGNTITIDMGASYSPLTISLKNILGQELQTKTYDNTQLINLNIEGEPGTYLVELKTKDQTAVFRVVKN